MRATRLGPGVENEDVVDRRAGDQIDTPRHRERDAGFCEVAAFVEQGIAKRERKAAARAVNEVQFCLEYPFAELAA